MAFQALSKFVYGPTPEERVKAWQQDLRKESRMLDRELRAMDTALSRTRLQLKQLANKGDVKNAKILAREVVRSNKQKERLGMSKARLNSINMQLGQQLGEPEPIAPNGDHDRYLIQRFTTYDDTQQRSRSLDTSRNRQRS